MIQKKVHWILVPRYTLGNCLSPTWMLAYPWDSAPFFCLCTPWHLGIDRAMLVYEALYKFDTFLHREELLLLLFLLLLLLFIIWKKWKSCTMEKAPKWVKWEIRYPSSLKSPSSISSTWVQPPTISQAFFDSVMSTPCIIMLSRIIFLPLFFFLIPLKFHLLFWLHRCIPLKKTHWTVGRRSVHFSIWKL